MRERRHHPLHFSRCPVCRAARGVARWWRPRRSGHASSACMACRVGFGHFHHYCTYCLTQYGWEPVEGMEMEIEGGLAFAIVDHGELVRCRRCQDILVKERPAPVCSASLSSLADLTRGVCHLCAVRVPHRHYHCARCGEDTLTRSRVEWVESDGHRDTSPWRVLAASIALAFITFAMTAGVILALRGR